MQDVDFKRFMFEQKIKQKELAEYLGLSKGYISLVISGQRPLSNENLRKLIDNPFGWDTSILKSSFDESSENQLESPIKEMPSLETKLIAQLSATEIVLRDMLAEERARVDALNEVIWELKEENGKLKALLNDERKGGTAANADFSSAVDAI